MKNELLDREIAAYEARQGEMEREHMGKWVVFHDQQFIGAYDTFEAAAEDAMERFGYGPYHIREVGASRIATLPPSVLLHMPRE